jgi:hypothetical protein
MKTALMTQSDMSQLSSAMGQFQSDRAHRHLRSGFRCQGLPAGREAVIPARAAISATRLEVRHFRIKAARLVRLQKAIICLSDGDAQLSGQCAGYREQCGRDPIGTDCARTETRTALGDASKRHQHSRARTTRRNGRRQCRRTPRSFHPHWSRWKPAQWLRPARY